MSNGFVTVIELVGTFAFAVSGAIAGVRKGVDLFGVLVLAFAAATAGGVARDLLLGATPPVAFADIRYLVVAIFAGLIAFFRLPWLLRLRSPVELSDAVGLGLFAVIGTTKAIQFGLGPVGAVMVGVLSAIGGGIARDVLTMEIPRVLRRELYAVAALFGSALVVAGDALGLHPVPVSLAAASGIVALRLLAMRRGWHLPVAKPTE